ncbi:MAG TPA: hypothetical protein VF183_02345 [Acidimicrobiales bacterium]
MRRRAIALLVLTLSASTLAVVTSAPRAEAIPWGFSWSGDYATDEWGDPWDFSNDEDWDVQARHESPGIANGHVSGGTLNFDVVSPAGGVLIGSAHYGDAALQWGRSTWPRPIDGSLYTTLSFRLYVPPGTSAPAGGVTWFSCGATVPSCAHSFSFHPQADWQTYTFTPGWAGQRIYSLLIVPTAHTGNGFALDFVRVTRPGGQVSQPAPGTEPIPVVLDPDRLGGEDYATTRRGNPWDLADGSDVARFENLDSVVFAYGLMHACNTSNDPAIELAMGPPINGSEFHRLTMNVYYEGGFSLANAPGGGMNARVMWQVAGVPGWQVSEDIVIYPGWNAVDIDLATWPFAHLVNEKDLGGGVGWAGQTITAVRIDFHEDPGRRCFLLSDVALRADDVAAPSFAIRFRDDSAGVGTPAPGTTAEIFLDDFPGGFDGTRIASGIPVTNGVNTFVWNGGSVPPGTYWVWVRLVNPANRSSAAYANGPLRYTGIPPVAARSVTSVDTGSGGQAVFANLTMVDAPGTGYITADRCSNLSSASTPTTSNGNFQIAQARANLGVIPIDSNGRFCIWNESPVHLIADIQGRFTTSGQLGFTPFTPPRFDTRVTRRPGDRSLTKVSTGAPSSATAVLVNITTTESTAAAYITANKCSAFGSGEPSTSNGNTLPDRNVANLAVVPVENGELCIYSYAATHLVVDVQGYFSATGTRGLSLASNPTRVLDTRSRAMPGKNGITEVDTGLGASAEAALVNLTMVDAAGAGYITAGRCSTMTPGYQPSSNGNFVAGQAIANLAVVPIENGRFCIYTENPVHLVVDVQGSFSTSGNLRLNLQSPPLRARDTRQA